MIILFLWGCLHFSSQLPGPLRSVGKAPKSYVERYNLKQSTSSAIVDAGGEAAATPTAKERPFFSRYDLGSEVASESMKMVGKTRMSVEGKVYRYDCSGLVEAVYAAAGLELRGNVIMMHERAKSEGVFHRRNPQLGDLVFFDNSYDRNKNGRRDDKLTHVGLVESVDSDGTVTVIHLGSRGVVPIHMNLEHPSEYKSPEGKVWNSFLRAPSKRDKGARLTGELFAGFGSLWKSETAPQNALLLEPTGYYARYLEEHYGAAALYARRAL
jgi:hypothetical protein